VWVNVITGFCVEWMGRQMAAFLFAGWFLPGAGRKGTSFAACVKSDI